VKKSEIRTKSCRVDRLPFLANSSSKENASSDTSRYQPQKKQQGKGKRKKIKKTAKEAGGVRKDQYEKGINEKGPGDTSSSCQAGRKETISSKTSMRGVLPGNEGKGGIP